MPQHNQFPAPAPPPSTRDEPGEPTPLLIAVGNPADGLRFVGPVIANTPDTDDYLERELAGQTWWYVPLEPLPACEPGAVTATAHTVREAIDGNGDLIRAAEDLLHALDLAHVTFHG